MLVVGIEFLIIEASMNFKSKDAMVYGKVLQELLLENKFTLLEYFLEHESIKNHKEEVLGNAIGVVCSVLTRENCDKAIKGIEYVFNKKELKSVPLNLEEIVNYICDFLIQEGAEGSRKTQREAVFSKWKSLVEMFESKNPGFLNYSWERKDVLLEDGVRVGSNINQILKKEREHIMLPMGKERLLDILLSMAGEQSAASLNSYFSWLTQMGGKFSLDKKNINKESGPLFNYFAQLGHDCLMDNFEEQKKILDLLLKQMKDQGSFNIPLDFESSRVGVLESGNLKSSRKGTRTQKVVKNLEDSLNAQEKKNILYSTDKCLLYKTKNTTGLLELVFANLSDSLFDDYYSINQSLSNNRLNLEVFKYLCKSDLKLSGQLSKNDLSFLSSFGFALKEFEESMSDDNSPQMKKCFNNFNGFLKEIAIALGQSDVSLKELKKVLPSEIFVACEKERLSKDLNSKKEIILDGLIKSNNSETGQLKAKVRL